MQRPGTEPGPLGILLCAGFGRGFGGDKLLAPLADGTPVAVASARTLVAALGPLGRAVAVLRPGQQALRSALADTGIALLSSAAAVEGMGAALAAAVQAHAQAPGWVVALGDMPCVAKATVRQVAAALVHDDALVAPFHQGRRGHPVGFGRHWGPQLTSLGGDEGARALLRQQEGRLIHIAVDDPGCLLDVDTPQDLAGLPPPAG
ncbi:NTP transferase domain-containing protein [Ideonella sp. B508-1]|uniref:nucleotidyltransferase family protein n=1 Tax=Ideonella sp. B508-1 TaxID=137716 RepID=UPI0003B47EDC|nr:nucleotidyltransferase family protein [Ideonella sp. B508-1]